MILLKYPKTYHVPWSPGISKSDRRHKIVDFLLNSPTVITEKLDGSSVMIGTTNWHARSIQGIPRWPAFDWLKANIYSLQSKIPPNLLVYVEYLKYKHTIYYNALPNAFILLNIYDVDRGWLPYSELNTWSHRLELPMPPVLFKGNISTIKELETLMDCNNRISHYGDSEMEGCVIRLLETPDWSLNSAKWVRYTHVASTATHWALGKLVENRLV